MIGFSSRLFTIIKRIPAVVRLVKNWPVFLLNYSGITNKGATYKLRNGLIIKTDDGVSTSTIELIFINKDYGDPPPPNSVVIDIGASIGIYTLYASQSLGTIVYAYDPLPKNFNLLKENIRTNDLEDRVFCFPFAVSGKEEKRKLYLGDASELNSFFSDSIFTPSSNKQPIIEVPCISLKQILDKYIQCDLLKIDCEGAEFEILYNLPERYFSRIKNIRLEYHNHLNNPKNTGTALIEFLKNRGFKLTKLKKNSYYRGDVWMRR